MSLSFQPKPLSMPYNASIEAGAAAGVLWQVRQGSLVILIGLAMYKEGPAGVDRMPLSTLWSGSRLNSWTRSASQATARSRGLVGLRVASL